MIIYPDGSTLYWLEGYPNILEDEKDKTPIVKGQAINEMLQKITGDLA